MEIYSRRILFEERIPELGEEGWTKTLVTARSSSIANLVCKYPRGSAFRPIVARVVRSTGRMVNVRLAHKLAIGPRDAGSRESVRTARIYANDDTWAAERRYELE